MVMHPRLKLLKKTSIQLRAKTIFYKVLPWIYFSLVDSYFNKKHAPLTAVILSFLYLCYLCTILHSETSLLASKTWRNMNANESKCLVFLSASSHYCFTTFLTTRIQEILNVDFEAGIVLHKHEHKFMYP